jgi:hypothetical protein|tara:strand:+ start:1297 stop:2193 length:897 start_codon:yes stop_codon:yes gene_type:complete
MKDRTNISGTIKQILPFKPSTLETIDYAMYDWIQQQMDVFCTTNKGFKKVPCVWVSGERSSQIKNHKNLRDSEGTLIFPIIAIRRNKFEKNPNKKGNFYGNVFPVPDKKGGSITIARQVQQNKSANFLNADTYRKKSGIAGNAGEFGGQQINFPNKKNKNPKIVYETITIPMPVYVDVSYTISVRTEYQQQMNEIVQPFVVNTGGINSRIIVSRDDHQYEAFMQQDFATKNNVAEMGSELRIYETEINVNVLGYLVGADKNQEQPNIVIRENAVQVRIPRERVIFGDIPDWKNGKYRS